MTTETDPAPAASEDLVTDKAPVEKADSKPVTKPSPEPSPKEAAPASAPEAATTEASKDTVSESTRGASTSDAATGTGMPGPESRQDEEGGLFGGGWAGLTEGIGQLWGSVSGEGGEVENENGNEEIEENSALLPTGSPALAPLTKAATDLAANATSELEHASKAAQAGAAAAAREVERGWGALNSFLDDFLSPPVDGSGGVNGGDTQGRGAENGTGVGAAVGSGGAARGIDSINQVSLEGASELLHERFPMIDSAEEAVEVYRCALVQKYRSTLNSATPEKTFALHGVLYVTPANLAFWIVDDSVFGKQLGCTIAFADVKRVQKGSKLMLRVLTADKQSYVFASFESEDVFKAAVDLMHHLVGADEKPLPTDATTATTANEPKADS